MHGLDLGDNTDYAKWLDLLPRPLARGRRRRRAHRSRRQGSRGARALRDWGAAQARRHRRGLRLDVITPFGRGREGKVRITVATRTGRATSGHARTSASRIAELQLRSHDDGAVSATLAAPESARGGLSGPPSSWSGCRAQSKPSPG